MVTISQKEKIFCMYLLNKEESSINLLIRKILKSKDVEELSKITQEDPELTQLCINYKLHNDQWLDLVSRWNTINNENSELQLGIDI